MNQTVTLQVGVFPGKVECFSVEVGMTVAEVLEVAGFKQGAEQDIKVDGEVVDASYRIDADTESVVLAKRIKAACGETERTGK